MLRSRVVCLTLSLTAICVGAEQWYQLTPATAPPARAGHRLAYDQATNRLIIFGGSLTGTVLFDDTWVLTNANGLGGAPLWTQLTPSGTPGPRTNSGSSYNSNTNRLILFGGRDAVTTYNDVWVLTNANGLGGAPQWTQLATSGSPPAIRGGTTAVYDQTGNRLIVFGGCSSPNPFFCFNFINDTWVLSNADGTGGTPVWQQLTPSGGPPSGRASHSAAYDPTTNRMIISGGQINGLTFTDTWVLTAANGLGGAPQWIQLAPPTPSFYGANAAAAFDPLTNQFFIGPGVAKGTPGDFLSSDVWRLDAANGIGTPNWVKLTPTGGLPSTRNSIQMAGALDIVDKRYMIFGGHDNAGNLLNDTWVLDLNPSTMTVCLLYDATKAKKSGSTVPIKLQLCNGDGENISSPDTILHAVSVTLASTMISGPVEDSGNANSDNDFRYDGTLGGDGGYVFNLNSAGLATGTYNVNFSVNGGGALLAAPFEIR
jgi:hypothetical protein